MTEVKLKYVDSFPDRHGKVRYRYRKGHGQRIVLVGRPGTPEFIASYQSGSQGELREYGGRKRGEGGTFDRLVQDYYASPDYLSLGQRRGVNTNRGSSVF
jgi:hypothetical protein